MFTTEILQTQQTEYEKIIINKGEHLSDAVLKKGIDLKPGIGFKNYR